MGWFDPGSSTKIPPRSVRLTDVAYAIGKELPAILSIRDLEWERDTGRPCSMRRNLEKGGYKVEPPFGEDVVV